MKEEPISVRFDYGAVLCPNCHVGKIESGEIRVSAFDCSNHLEAHIHMVCPNCGDRLLVQGDGKTIGYNFKDNSCDSRKLTIVEY